MKLYKYTTLDAAFKIIDGQSIHFARMSDFNDPFEGPFPNAPEQLEGFKQQSYPLYFRNDIDENFVILSLTRNPLNPLMWSHYGNAHSGCVIEIDIEKAGFDDENICTVPASYGDVIYTASKPNYKHAQQIIDLKHEPYGSFLPDKYLAVKAAFLYKHTSWAYEEEVRIVKYLPQLETKKNHSVKYSEDWDLIVKDSYKYKLTHGQTIEKTDFLNLFHLPNNCITRIFTGSKLVRMSVAPNFQELYKEDPNFNNVKYIRAIQQHGIDIQPTSAMTADRTIALSRKFD